ncbi:MAG: ArsR family transcriptional regulator [Petrotogales bacterium]
MKRRESFVLDKEDEEIIRLFTDLGMPKNLSKTLMYLCQVDECRSGDVERGADLRQPEVSVAMQELRKRGWVKKRDLKKKSKGRPVHIYEPTTDLSKVWKSLEQEKLKEIESVKSGLSELENIIKNR